MGDIIFIPKFKDTGKESETLTTMNALNNLIEELANAPANKCNISQAERLAAEVMEYAGYGALIGATPIVTLAQKLGFTCYAENIGRADVSGNIFIGGTTETVYGTDKVIIVEKTEEEAHRRFIIAHELAHYILDYFGSEQQKNPDKLFQEAYYKQNHTSEREIRADRFAAELLMPAKLFFKQYNRAMEAYNYEKKYVIEYLAQFFNVKKTSIMRRIEEVFS